MAKKTAAKKPKRRLKRAVRRSFAAVLMITAIVVAAIPVPENLAEDGGTDPGTDVSRAIEYVPLEESLAFEDNPGGEHSITHNPGDDNCSDINLNMQGGGLPSTLSTAIKQGELYATVRSNMREGALYLEWEFLYHHEKGKRAVLCKYNNEKNRERVVVNELLRTDYQTVSQEQFNAYFSSDPRNYTDASNPMDNLKVTNGVYPATYPSNPIVYGPDNTTLKAGEEKFLEKYFPDEYSEKKKQVDDWLNRVTDEKPADLRVTPKDDLDDEQKMEFYCEHNRVLKGLDADFTLVAAHDKRLDTNGIEMNGVTVYVAQSDKKDAELGGGSVGVGDDVEYITDENGCLAKKNPDAILGAIGERAFANVTNVGEIVIPKDIRVIGDYAFEGAGMSGVELYNSAPIGNGAFRGCTQLSKVTFGEASGIETIGAEAFRGCSSLSSIKFPWSLKTVGYGAFSNCPSLAEVDFTLVNGADGCALKDFAFYNDKALTDSGLKFENSSVSALGKGCFALETMDTTASMIKFKFPAKITGKNGNGLGGYVLANRVGLTEVTMPDNYQGEIPHTTFYNCANLHNVIFPDTCGGAGFKEDLFAHVTDEGFFVRGPENYNGQPAQPRQSTWSAKTRVSGETGVPYVYKDSQGNDCYEVAMRSGESVYRYEIDSDGTLKSCVLISGTGAVDIIIPERVGTIDVKSIGEGCFSDETLRKKIRSITIKDKSISKIDKEAFAGLPALEKVRIGDSVNEIGERAFADCPKLYNVYFNTPAAGYGSEAFKMAETAFQTGGRKLTFHGDIVKGYAPFEYAMDVNHVLKDPDDKNLPDVNVCYMSRWDSENGTHLTVMVDRSSPEDVVLIDYPRLPDLSKNAVLLDEELKDYCEDMEQYYYNKVYDDDGYMVTSRSKTVGQLRGEYAVLLYAAMRGEAVATLNGQPVTITDALFEERYGPWINERYCEKDEEGHYNFVNWLPDEESGKAAGLVEEQGGLYDLLFEPLTVQAAGVNAAKWLKPYFDSHPYNFMENYQLSLDNPTGIGLEEYQTVPAQAARFIDGTETITVPEGVTSIDVTAYADQADKSGNCDNYNTYIGRNSLRTGPIGEDGKIPGLFNGRYVDYRDDDGAAKKDPHEQNILGNDVIKRVEFASVKRLPDYAFDNCEQLKTVVFGEGMSEIGKLPFRGCSNMTEVIGNEKYPVEKGIIFEKQTGDREGKYKIIECLIAKGRVGTNDAGLEEKEINPGTITLLKDVDEIADSAFEGCDNIIVVDFTDLDDLKIIPEGCFKDCTKLTDVLLPVSVNKIHENAFNGVTDKDGNHSLEVTIRGREVDIADNAFSPKNGVTIRSYLDSAAKRYVDRFDPPMVFKELGSYRVKFFDYDGTQVGKTQELERKGTEALYAREPDEAKALYEEGHRKGYRFNGEWLAINSHNVKLTLSDPIEEDLTTFIAQYESDGTSVNGQYVVEFYDGVDGALLRGTTNSGASEDGRYYVDAGMSFADLGFTAPTHPQHAGYEPLNYSDNWTIDTVINSNMSIIALYKASSTSGGSTSGGSTSSGSTSSGSTSKSSTSKKSSSDKTSSSTSSSSTSTTSTTSSGAGQYTVFVEGGSGSGSYTPGTTVIISAYAPAEGMQFDKWTTESNGVTLASVSMTSTTFTMPANNVTIKANYKAGETPSAPTNTNGGSGGNSGNNTGNNNGNGNTRVDIDKPGISNRDLATANTNGSTDNFIVKITETDEATRAVAAALTNKYGTLDNILYYAMDISLYDSTGTTKITDTTGLSVDITIPIPDSLVAYGGNNMAGAVVNGDQLESLNESFTTINGVPCIRFRATHFSPYTVYVDTGNLVEGMLDVTPKTGDPIHPKWFLSLGLACLSIILFIKKDKRVAVKKA